MKKFTKAPAPARIESANNLTCVRRNSVAGAGVFFCCNELKMKPFFVIIESLSTPASGYGINKTALIHAFVFSDTKEQAEEKAIQYLNNAGWIKIELMATFERFALSHLTAEWMKAYLQAEEQGFGYDVFLKPDDGQTGVDEDTTVGEG